MPAPDPRVFRTRLLRWYSRHARPLPWRETTDAYRVWVSEVMLQQTRVAAVLPRYSNFLARFPNVQALAAASIDDVLAEWSGLGYYRRARALHAAAREIVARGGDLPKNMAGWAALPGVGRYTAAAVASIAFDEAAAVVDGNVERVLARVLGEADLSHSRAWEEAARLLAPRAPGTFNQAMMELGATVCTPRGPRCESCPVFALCATRGEHPRKAQPARKRREIACALCQRGGELLLHRRSESESVMPGMWELPELRDGADALPAFTLKHSITNTDYTVKIFAAQACDCRRGATWIEAGRLAELPLTGLTRKALRRAGIIE